MKKTKKQRILEIVEDKPFIDLNSLADDLDTNVEYIKEVLRDNEVNVDILKLEKYINKKMQYRDLSEKYTELIIDNAILKNKTDMLKDLFELQKKMQLRLNDDNIPGMKPERIPMTVTSIISELGEILEEQQAWKDWKENPNSPDLDNLRMEVADLWHFVINLTLYLGMDSEDLYQEFLDKNKINHKRQDNNY
ncbi:MAG: dUTPase [Bacillota bacterium]